MCPVKSDRAQRITAATQSPEAKSEMGKHPIVIGGQKRMFEVYRVPTNLLAFNIRNGRFAAELRAKEKRLGRHVDPLVPEDEDLIRDLLVGLDPHATKLLKDDLAKVGQTDPGIITHDGFVINGNRRMAILQELHKVDSSGKFEHLEVQILTRGVGEKDLWRIEAGLQLSRDQRLEYGPVNDLLKIREGLRSGLTAHEIAATLYGVKDAEEVQAKDRRLVLIDSYLDYVGDPENYTRVNGAVEHFINLQGLLKSLEDQEVKASERHQWLLRAFEMIRAGMGHMDIRQLRNIAKSEAASSHFIKALAPKAGARKPEVEAQKKATTEEAFETAKDYYENEKESKRPESLLKKAKRAIEILLKHQDDLAAKRGLHAEVASLAQMTQELNRQCQKGRKGKFR